MARTAGKTVTDAVRTAIDEHIDARRKRTPFMDLLKARQRARALRRLTS